jgi:hypothetical protein
MIPFCSRCDSSTFTPGLSAIGSKGNFSRCPLNYSVFLLDNRVGDGLMLERTVATALRICDRARSKDPYLSEPNLLSTAEVSIKSTCGRVSNAIGNRKTFWPNDRREARHLTTSRYGDPELTMPGSTRNPLQRRRIVGPITLRRPSMSAKVRQSGTL